MRNRIGRCNTDVEPEERSEDTISPRAGPKMLAIRHGYERSVVIDESKDALRGSSRPIKRAWLPIGVGVVFLLSVVFFDQKPLTFEVAVFFVAEVKLNKVERR